jgi:hypothetical protein
MLVTEDPEVALGYIPGSPAAYTDTFGGAGPRVFVQDAATLNYDSPWASAPLNADIALTLTYDGTLSRVRISATGMDVFTLVKVERSTDQIRWTTVRGGAAVTVAGGTFRLDDYEFTPNVLNYYRIHTLAPFGQYETGSITPTITAVWLKSVARPYLNLTVRLLGNTFSVQRSDRGGTFPIVGRSLPVAVTDVRGSRQYPLKARTDDDTAATNLELLLASGDVLYLQAPTGFVVPAGGVFVNVGQVTVETPAPPAKLRFTTFTVTEVAAPGADVVGSTASWQTVINTYATWADVLAAAATWADLLELVGAPSEVIVP